MKGKTVEEAERMFERFHQMLVSGADDLAETGLGKLNVLCGVREFPARVKCASLAWHTLHAALAEGGETVTTE